MFINKNYLNLKKVAEEKSSTYLQAKPFPSIVFDNFFDEEVLNKVLNDFPKNIKGIGNEFNNKAEKKLSIASLITEKNNINNLIIFSDFKKEIKKTKEMSQLLKKFEATNSLLILDQSSKDKIYRSTKNIPNLKVTDVNHFSAFDIIKFKKIIFTESSIKELEKRYS